MGRSAQTKEPLSYEMKKGMKKLWEFWRVHVKSPPRNKPMNSYLSGVSVGRERSRITWDLHLPPADTHPRLSRTQSRGARLDAALTRRHRDQLEVELNRMFRAQNARSQGRAWGRRSARHPETLAYASAITRAEPNCRKPGRAAFLASCG